MLLLRIIASIFFLAGLAMLGWGASIALTQHRENTTSAVTTGTVEATSLAEVRIRTKQRGTQTRYRPVIAYTYAVDGRTYRGDQFRPTESSFSLDTARQIRDAFRPGASLPVFYMTANPQRSFLQRHTSFDPYGLVMMAAFFVTGGLILLLLQPAHGTPPPAAGGSGYVLPPRQRLRRRRNVLLLASVVWIAALLALAHYLLNARPIETIGWVFGGLFGAAAIVVFGWTTRLVLLTRDAADATVRIATPSLQRGSPQTIDVALPLRDGLGHGAISVSLVCLETVFHGSGGKRGTRQHEVQRHTQPLREPGTAPHAPIAGQVRFTLPADAPPSSPPTHKGYPRFDWEVRIEAPLVGRPDYLGRFPLPVI
jgi:hypothetical protein